MQNDLIPILISIIISVCLFFIGRTIIYYKLKELHGSSKLLGIISLAIIFGEVLYLGLTSGLFDFALEIIASIGVGIVLLGIAFQNSLRNWVAGIGIFFNSKIDVGDTIQIGDVKGKIIKIGISKTTATTETNSMIFIPNSKFNEEIVIITHNNQT